MLVKEPKERKQHFFSIFPLLGGFIVRLTKNLIKKRDALTKPNGVKPELVEQKIQLEVNSKEIDDSTPNLKDLH